MDYCRSVDTVKADVDFFSILFFASLTALAFLASIVMLLADFSFLHRINMNDRTLAEATIELLAHRDRTITLAKISSECDVTVAWLSTLLSETPPREPGADKIQRLYEFLTGKKLVY
jgi:hypothetical protein